MRYEFDHSSCWRLALRAGSLLGAVLGAAALSAGVASAATITVNTSADEFATGPTTCSLREAIQSANIDADFGGCTGIGGYGNDTIVFDSSVTVVNLTIVSGSTPNDDNRYLDLDIGDTNPNFPNDLTIDGGASGVTIQPNTPNWTDRIFDLVLPAGSQPGAVVLRNLTIQGGTPPSNETSSGSPCFNSGGGVRNQAGVNLTLDRVTIQNNTMPTNGGGVCHQNAGQLQVLGSTIRNNIALNMMGGGIYATGNNASLQVQTSILRDNTAARGGGGIYDATGAFTLANSQVLSNCQRAQCVWWRGRHLLRQHA